MARKMMFLAIALFVLSVPMFAQPAGGATGSTDVGGGMKALGLALLCYFAVYLIPIIGPHAIFTIGESLAQHFGQFATYPQWALTELGATLLVRTLEDPPPCREQDDELATYAEKISASDRLLDPLEHAAALERKVRALAPHIGARLQLSDGTALGVLEAAVVEDGPSPGSLSVCGRRPLLGCADGALDLVTVHPPGRRPMSGEAYLRGRRT